MRGNLRPSDARNDVTPMKHPFQSPTGRAFLDNLEWARLLAMGKRGEVSLVFLGAVVGTLSGLVVALLSFISRSMHRLIYGPNTVDGLSVLSTNNRVLLLAGPIAGGLLLGALIYVLARTRKKAMVDPIEANALHGGRLSLTDSVIVAIQNLISNGFGASVGLEAGYTQLACGMASKLGFKLKLRRADLRVLVGCGAAGAIAAAFSAPLTGAFYAFELIIGTYSIVTLAPVVTAALVASVVSTLLRGESAMIELGASGHVMPQDYLPALLLGIVAAVVGIAIMQAVSLVEELARRSAIPPALRPALGGVVVGLLALASTQVLSAGHGALHLDLSKDIAMPALIGLFLLKAFASAISIGSGFRGGLFFASLFLGALLGKAFAYSAPFFDHATLTPMIYAVIGMSSLAVTIIGGPLTMTFLALEITGDFAITALVLASVITASIVARNTFGYSFATWRFHLRGESIRSAHDIGWIRTLTVRNMMRADVRTARSDMRLAEFRQAYPLGSTSRVILADAEGRYAGIILLPDIYASPVEKDDHAQGLDAFIRCRDDFLLLEMNAKEAAALFERTDSEALAVVDSRFQRRVIGMLTESHTLRRYSEELDRQRRDASGEI